MSRFCDGQLTPRWRASECAADPSSCRRNRACHLERVEDRVSANVCGVPPANNHATERVDDEAHTRPDHVATQGHRVNLCVIRPKIMQEETHGGPVSVPTFRRGTLAHSYEREVLDPYLT
jgi:hypothetical protein